MKFNRINLAKKLILAEKYNKAKSLLRTLAKNNHAGAQLLLGYLYYGGDIKTTAKESKYWLEKSAKNGNAEAMALLAATNFKVSTWSSEPGSRKALLLTFKAANKGSAEAQRSLACAYAHGTLVLKDDVQTMYWDEKAAKQGLAESQNDLAVMLLYGLGGTIDVEKAIFWYQESASKDHNAPYAQWAAEALARIYGGEPKTKYFDLEKSEFWKNRALHLSNLPLRGYPDWFYK